MTVTVETSAELRAAAAQAPAMLDAVEGRWMPPPFQTEHQGGFYRDVLYPLQAVVQAAGRTAEDPPDEPYTEPAPNRYAPPSQTRYGTLTEFVYASANTSRMRNNRRQAQRWARYRDSLADTAMAQWNVLVRRWAVADAQLQPRQVWADPWDEQPPTTRRRSEPVVEPILLNL